MKKPFSKIAALIFAIVCAAHLARLCLGWDITVGHASLPLWVSAPGMLVTGLLAAMVWRESRGN